MYFLIFGVMVPPVTKIRPKIKIGKFYTILVRIDTNLQNHQMDKHFVKYTF